MTVVVRSRWFYETCYCGSYCHLSCLHCTLASCSTVYCNRSCLWVCVCVCLWICYHDNSKLPASILTKTGFAGKGSDPLQMIKFWPSRTPGRGSAAGQNFWLHLTAASVQCLRLLRALFSLYVLLYVYRLAYSLYVVARFVALMRTTETSEVLRPA